MAALYIILGILGVFAFLLLLLLLPIKASLVYNGVFEVKIKYLLFKKTLFKAVPGEKAKTAVPKKPKEREKEKEDTSRKDKEELESPSVGELVPVASEVFKKVLSRFGKSARLEKAVFKCLVASDDPAKTAVIYGAVSGAAGNLFVLLKSLKRRSKRKGSVDFLVEPDFVAERFELFADVRISAVPLKLLIALLSAWRGYKRIRSLWKEKPEETKNKRNESDKGEENHE